MQNLFLLHTQLYAQSLKLDNSLNSSEHETMIFHRGNDWVSLFPYRC